MGSSGRMVMPWGRYRDEYIDEIPSSYLRYVAENWDEDNPYKKRIVQECDDEWQWRDRTNNHFED